MSPNAVSALMIVCWLFGFASGAMIGAVCHKVLLRKDQQ